MQQIGPYRVLGELGRGGMGTVFLAQGPDGGEVALKLLHASRAAGAGPRERFAR
ncbi:MAG: hypothetical protein KDD82_23685 [Planctomycetes bacterium]|nr:hypothetical protein [Planctomycetota bacterium]